MSALAAPERRLVILDRDGVINRDSPTYIKKPSEWLPLPGALQAIARLTAAGWTVAVATNQSGVGRGLFSEETLAQIHGRMLAEVEAVGGRIAGIFYCPHAPEAGCTCRKPAPGLLLQAAADLGFEIEGVPYIGDKGIDVEAARAAGARPILVGSRDATHGTPETGVERYPDLAAAADGLLEDAAC